MEELFLRKLVGSTFAGNVVVSGVLSILASGATIFSVFLETGERVRVKAKCRTLHEIPRVGDALLLTANVRESSAFGIQFHAISSRPTMPSGRLIIEYLASSSSFRGIGKIKAERLFAEFGDRLYAILNTGIRGPLLKILTTDAADNLLSAWALRRAEAECMQFFSKHNFSISMARLAIRAWGLGAVSILEKNPYSMLACCDWSVVDRAALRLGLHERDGRRLVGCIESCLYDRLVSGHTVTSAELLKAQFSQRLATELFGRALRLALDQHSVAEVTPLGFQAVAVHVMEVFVTQTLAARLPTNRIRGGALSPNHGADKIIVEATNLPEPFRLSVEQVQAVSLLQAARFGILVGPAGSGKTTVLGALCRRLKLAGKRMILAAVAARAARKMEEASGHPATTIASLLHRIRTGQWEMGNEDILVIDEASMLDLPSMFALCRILPVGARIILVGDDRQLPPIGFGLILQPLLKSTRVPIARLVEIKRHTTVSGIAEFANLLRAGRTEAISEFRNQRAGASLVRCGVADVQKNVRNVIPAFDLDEWMILTPTKSGPAGSTALNTFFHEENPGVRLHGLFVAEGDRVIHTVNDYDNGLLNGTVGKVLQVRNGGCNEGVVVRFDSKDHFFSKTDVYERLVLGYAISIHKAQGSEFSRVVVIGFKSRFLDGTMLYSAVTRATEQVVIIGEEDCIQTALARISPSLRRDVAIFL